jgi:anti-sigma regulatory factor (Ser/Thr protein kinase)
MNGDIEIGDLDNVLKLLGEVYDDPRDAIAEFITNSIDAKATEIVVEINKKSRNPYISISDNGFGMDEKELERIATNIGYSIKRLESGTVGEKGIGILGYTNFGNEMKIISSTKSSKTHSLFVRGSQYKIKEEGERKFAGTDVYIHGIDKNSRIISKGRLSNYYKDKFRQYLSTEEFKLYISDGKRRIKVMPDLYKGEPFPIFERKTDYGIVKFSLYVLPPKWGKPAKVSVYRKGILVIDNINQMDEFESDVWRANRVQGEINADFCDITSGRSGFIRDQNFNSFVDAVKDIETDLKGCVREEDRKFGSKIDKEIYKQLNRVFNEVLDNLKDFEKFKVQVISATGDEGKGKRTNVKTPISSGKDARTKGNGKSVVTSGDEPIRTKLGTGFNWDAIPFDDYPEMRSRLDLNYRAILINTIHPDYKEVMHSPDDKMLYLLRLTAKEIALFNYREAKPEILLEKVVGLEISAEKVLAGLLG